MKKTLLLVVVVSMALLALSAGVLAQDEPIRIINVVNGVLGDQSFFDSSQRGVEAIADEFGAEINTVELGIDAATWESGLNDVMSDSDSYDIMITGTFQMNGYLGARAHLYPDKVFIHYDAPVAYADPAICVEGCTNVYSISYKQNEGSLLAGVYAAAMALEMGAEAPILGAVGGQDIPVINDFIVGYEQGACLVNADSQVLVQYAGGWNDPARGKEIALAMYEQGANIVFQIAGGTGVGVFEAAFETENYAIGVDSDQAMIMAETDPDLANFILTSMQKNVDNSLFRAFELYQAGELPLGMEEALGLAEGGVSLSVNDIYLEATPQNVQDLVSAITEAVNAGEITIVSAFGDEAIAPGTACADMPEVTFDVSEFLGS
ncbi:MAG TPA: BMP family ABC transporter substrate-binding protein [Candidatus Limnocylindrales bacterium]|nr:BMP family ABC transporter substrate-binding protein [Candidatus Limnocylindrales bacterium]